jgi:penicillin-binding protein-related factor A (putative recombinase)
LKERDFQQQLIDNIRRSSKGVHIYNIPDIPRVEGLSFQRKRPYDFYILSEGDFIAVELKLLKAKRLPFNAVKPHQEEALFSVRNNGGRGLVCFGFFYARKKAQRINEVFIMDIEFFASLRDQTFPKKSVPLDHLIALCKKAPGKCVLYEKMKSPRLWPLGPFKEVK